jgi:hypothetical protein
MPWAQVQPITRYCRTLRFSQRTPTRRSVPGSDRRVAPQGAASRWTPKDSVSGPVGRGRKSMLGWRNPAGAGEIEEDVLQGLLLGAHVTARAARGDRGRSGHSATTRVNIGKEHATAIRSAGRGSSVLGRRQSPHGGRKGQELGIVRYRRRVHLGRRGDVDPPFGLLLAHPRNARAHVRRDKLDRRVGIENSHAHEPGSEVIACDVTCIDPKRTRCRAVHLRRQPAGDALEIGRTVPGAALAELFSRSEWSSLAGVPMGDEIQGRAGSRRGGAVSLSSSGRSRTWTKEGVR